MRQSNWPSYSYTINVLVYEWLEVVYKMAASWFLRSFEVFISDTWRSCFDIITKYNTWIWLLYLINKYVASEDLYIFGNTISLPKRIYIKEPYQDLTCFLLYFCLVFQERYSNDWWFPSTGWSTRYAYVLKTQTWGSLWEWFSVTRDTWATRDTNDLHVILIAHDTNDTWYMSDTWYQRHVILTAHDTNDTWSMSDTWYQRHVILTTRDINDTTYKWHLLQATPSPKSSHSEIPLHVFTTSHDINDTWYQRPVIPTSRGINVIDVIV